MAANDVISVQEESLQGRDGEESLEINPMAEKNNGGGGAEAMETNEAANEDEVGPSTSEKVPLQQTPEEDDPNHSNSNEAHQEQSSHLNMTKDPLESVEESRDFAEFTAINEGDTAIDEANADGASNEREVSSLNHKFLNYFFQMLMQIF